MRQVPLLHLHLHQVSSALLCAGYPFWAALCNHSKGMPFHPKKYFAGLPRSTRKRRAAEIRRFGAMSWRDPAAWKTRFPEATSLEAKAAATGVPIRYIRESYNRGLAAWRTGHRPGATQQQWGYARVHSFLLCGKTARTTDSDLRREAIQASEKARRWFTSVACVRG